MTKTDLEVLQEKVKKLDATLTGINEHGAVMSGAMFLQDAMTDLYKELADWCEPFEAGMMIDGEWVARDGDQ